MLALCRTLIDQLGPLLDQPMPLPRAMMHLFKLHDALLTWVLGQAAKVQIPSRVAAMWPRVAT